MQEVRIQGLDRIRVRGKKGQVSEALLAIRYRRIRVLPPISTHLLPVRKDAVYGSLTV